jgi:hypothetical protein
MQLEKSVLKESQYTARALIEYIENFVIPPNKQLPEGINGRRFSQRILVVKQHTPA